jgi:hypothetical protein
MKPKHFCEQEILLHQQIMLHHRNDHPFLTRLSPTGSAKDSKHTEIKKLTLCTLFDYGLYFDAISNSHYTASNCRMVTKQ